MSGFSFFCAGVRRWLLLFTACYDQVGKINLRTELSELKIEGHCKIIRIFHIKGLSFFSVNTIAGKRNVYFLEWDDKSMQYLMDLPV